MELNQTETKIIWKMQEPTKIDDIYLKLELKLSISYIYYILRTLILKEAITKIKVKGNRYIYKSTPEALLYASDRLKNI